MGKLKPWGRQKKLIKKYGDADIPGIPEIIDMIGSINIVGKQTDRFTVLRTRALIAMYYLTGCRASEMLGVNKFKYKRFKREPYINEFGREVKRFVIGDDGKRIIEEGFIDRTDTDDEYSGLKKKDIRKVEFDGKPYMEIRTENRKNKKRTKKKQTIPLEFEEEIYKFIDDYISVLDPNIILFEFSQSRAKQIINETTNFNMHFWRHIRMTHLVTIYDFNEQLLIKFAGWTDARPAKNYMELSSKDIARAFYKNKRFNNT